MGVGYQVSPLHRLMHLNVSSMTLRAVAPGKDPILDTSAAATNANVVVGGPLEFRSPKPESIVAWRQRLASKYQDPLGEKLHWNEFASFERSEDVATSSDVVLRYIAAVLDQRGKEGLTELADRNMAQDEEMESAFAEAGRRGFGGSFPQLLLRAQIWLPFQRNLMIEEPDWDGNLARYGSVIRLADELTEIRASLSEVDPNVTRSLESADSSPNTFADAWQASSVIMRLASLATGKHLPLLTTG